MISLDEYFSMEDDREKILLIFSDILDFAQEHVEEYFLGPRPDDIIRKELYRKHIEIFREHIDKLVD